MLAKHCKLPICYRNNRKYIGMWCSEFVHGYKRNLESLALLLVTITIWLALATTGSMRGNDVLNYSKNLFQKSFLKPEKVI